MVYKTDIQVAIKGAKDLRNFQEQLKQTSTDVEVQNKLLRNLAKVNSLDLLPSIKNLNQALGEATQKFNQSVLGTKAATDAAKNLVDAERAVNKELQERERLLQSITLKGQTSSLTPGKSLFGQSVTPEGGASGRSRKILSESQDVQEALARMEQKDMKLVGQKVDVQERIKTILTEQNDLQEALLKLERKSTTELAEKAELRAKNKQQFQSEVQALANQANVEKAAMQAEVEATKNIVAEEIKRREAGKLSGIQRRQNMEMANKEVLLEMKLTKLAEKKARGQKVKGAIGSGLIGGAFPLLFGQGLGASVGGAAGGFAGGMMGGQFGFALSLVGTTLGSTVDRLAEATKRTGDALGGLTKNAEVLIQSLGNTNNALGQRVNLIKKAEGTQAAFAEAVRQTTAIVGTKGVTALKLYGDETKEIQTSLAQVFLQFQAGLARVNQFLGVTKALADLLPRDLSGELQDFIKNPKTKNLPIPGSRTNLDAATIAEQIRKIEKPRGIKEILFAETNKNRLKDLKKDAKDLIKIGNQIVNNTIAQELFNKELNHQIEINEARGFLARQEIRDRKKLNDMTREFEELTGEKAGENQIATFEKLIKKTNKLVLGIRAINDEIENLDKQIILLKDSGNQIVSAANAIGDAFSESFKGIIRGTMSVQEAFANMFNRIADHFADMAAKMAATQLQKGILSLFTKNIGSVSMSLSQPATLPTDLGSSFSTKQAFSFGGDLGFATGGYVNRPTNALVGEAGEGEYVIPASKMSSAMQRYSAGARGESVIPGTGSSQSVGGGGGSTTVNYSGPILTFNSEEFVPKSAVNDIISTAARQGASQGSSQTFATLRNSRSARSRIGL